MSQCRLIYEFFRLPGYCEQSLLGPLVGPLLLLPLFFQRREIFLLSEKWYEAWYNHGMILTRVKAKVGSYFEIPDYCSKF